MIVLSPKGPLLAVSVQDTRDIGECKNMALVLRDPYTDPNEVYTMRMVGCMAYSPGDAKRAGLALTLPAYMEAHQCLVKPITTTLDKEGYIATAVYACRTL